MWIFFNGRIFFTEKTMIITPIKRPMSAVPSKKDMDFYPSRAVLSGRICKPINPII